MSTRTIWIIGGTLAFLGLADALYLSYAHLTQNPLACSILEGCAIVANSPYSKIWGVPIAYLGVLYYIGMLKMAFWANFVPLLQHAGRKLFIWGAVLGASASVLFVYIQYTYIGAFCIYCLLSAIATWLLGLCAYMLKKAEKPLAPKASAEHA